MFITRNRRHRRRDSGQKRLLPSLIILIFTLIPAISCFGWDDAARRAIITVCWNTLQPDERSALNKLMEDPAVFKGSKNVSGLFTAIDWVTSARDHFPPPTSDAGRFLGTIHVQSAAQVEGMFVQYYLPGSPPMPDLSAHVLNSAIAFGGFTGPRATSGPDKSKAFAYALCIAMEMHDPLACGDSADHGGRDIRIEGLPGCPNLKDFWDHYLPAREGLTNETDVGDYIKNHVGPVFARAVWVRQHGWGLPVQWALESHNLAERMIYLDDHDKRLVSGDKLSEAYVDRGTVIYDRSVCLAGFDIANWLRMWVLRSVLVPGYNELPDSNNPLQPSK